MYLNDEEKKIIFYILSRNCWGCNEIKDRDYCTFQQIKLNCPRQDCDKLKMFYELANLSEHTSFKDFMGFDCPEDIDGWRSFFNNRKGWAS